ncbi:MAG: DNA primase [Clostridia bacterium]|nr:DNA primase [Clostridia bacterium]
MRGFDSRFLEELKSKNDIVDVVSRYVRLEQRGTNFWGKCPFHHEKTASFSVNSQGQFYYCFGCHKSGDVISFVMEIESLDFNDAVRLLAEKAKIPLPEVKYDDEKIKEQKKFKQRLYDLMKDTAKFYVDNLRGENGYKHVEYILKRKLSSQTVTAFGLGASLDFKTLPEYLKKKGYTYEEMLASGAVEAKDGRYFDAMGGRLIVPIIDRFNQVIAFGGRLLEKADFAKYKNTKETVIFSKSNNLYNLNNLKKLKNSTGINGVIIVEGYMDTISLAQAGFLNVVASMGTALTKDQARILKRYSEKVFICYDSDSAGQNATMRGLEILKDEGLDVKVVSMPEGMDPDDVVKNLGAEGYRNCILEAKPLVDFKLDALKRKFDLKSADGKRKFITGAMAIIKESPSPAEQEDLLKTVRDLTGITFETLKRELYSVEQKESIVNEPAPEFNDDTGDKTTLAARFVLYSYLFGKAYASETDISEIEFLLPVHKAIKRVFLEKRNAGETLRFNDLYEILPAEHLGELSKIAGMETDENKQYDQAVYFNDSLVALKSDAIKREIDALNQMFSAETDTAKRREIATRITKLLAEKKTLY